VGTCRSDDKRKNLQGRNINAEYEGGTARSSDEVSVMEMERRGRVIRL
jgi:hypothetical protein